MRYKIWYMTPNYFRTGIMGYDNAEAINRLPDPDNLARTHTLLTEIDVDNLDEIYRRMQGEVWSPNGEARTLIRSKGLQHTSMSVGDIAVDPDGNAFMVDMFGWKQIKAG